MESKTCQDRNCPFHGEVRIRGRKLEGVVVSDKMDKTVVVKIEHLRYVPKYDRYERRTSKIHAHNPSCVGAKEGDGVVIAECRKLSKTKSFVVVEVKGRR